MESTIETGYSLEGHAEGQSRRLAAPWHVLDLGSEDHELREGEPFREHGHEGKTLVKLPELRVVLVSLEAGARAVRHQAEGELTLQTLSGRVSVQLDGQRVDLPAGRLLAIAPALPHEVEASEESTLLVTLAWKPDR